MAKYELNQIIHYLQDNVPHSAPVLAIEEIRCAHDDWSSTKEQRSVFTPFGASRIRYGTCHGIYNEASVFGSKEEMLASL